MPHNTSRNELKQRVDALEGECARLREQCEKYRKDSEHLALLFDGTDEGIWEWDILSGKVSVDPNWLRILDYEPGKRELTFTWWVGRIHPESLDVFKTALHEYLEGRKKYLECEYRIQDRHGKWTWFWSRGIASAYDVGGQVQGIMGTYREITERKESAMAVRENETRLKSLFDTMQEGVILVGNDGIIVEANPAAERILGLTRDVIKGRNFQAPTWEVIRNDGTKMPFAEMPGPTAMREGRAIHGVEMGVKRPDMNISWISVSAAPIFNDLGEVRAVVGTFVDITDRKQAEENLHLQGEIMTNITEGVSLIRADNHTIVFTNPKFEQMFGYNPGELIGKNISIVNAPAEHSPEEMARNIINTLIQTGEWRGEVKNITKDGRPFWCRANVSTFSHSRYGRVFVSVHTNITKEKQMEEELRLHKDHLEKMVKEQTRELALSEERLRLLLNSTAEGIYGLDLDGNCIFCNPSCLHLLGYESEDDLLNRDIHSIIHHTRPDGSIYLEKECKIIRAISEGRGLYEDQEVFWRRDGSSIPVEYWSYPIKRGDTFIGTVVTFNDITMRKKAEERLNNYAETQKVLLKEVNHRVKNNLAAILGMLHQEQKRLEKTGLADYVPVIDDIVGRIRSLAVVHNLLSATDWRPLLLSELCNRIINSTLQGLSGSTKVDLRISPSSVRVNSNQAHNLTMIVNELATNSLKHAAKGRNSLRIDIDVSQDGDLVNLRFHDDGSGYSQEIINGEVRQTGIGFNLITGIVGKNLAGQVSFNNDNGAATQISFKNEVENRNHERS